MFPESVPGRVLTLAQEGAYALYFSPIILEELKRSLRNPRLRNSYSCSDERIDAWCAALHDLGTCIAEPLPEIEGACRDPDDDLVIAAAVAAKARSIVTGDKDLLVLGRYRNIRILSAKDFLDAIA